MNIHDYESNTGAFQLESEYQDLDRKAAEYLAMGFDENEAYEKAYSSCEQRELLS